MRLVLDELTYSITYKGLYLGQVVLAVRRLATALVGPGFGRGGDFSSSLRRTVSLPLPSGHLYPHPRGPSWPIMGIPLPLYRPAAYIILTFPDTQKYERKFYSSGTFFCLLVLLSG